MSRDRCARALALRVGDVLSVGKTRWRVERAHGVTSYVVKQGSKGRKLYTPTVTEIDPQCCIEVREVWPGSGDLRPGVKPAARGCLVGDGAVFAGASRGRARGAGRLLGSSDPFSQAKAERDLLDREVAASSEVLQRFPKGPTGWTPDGVKATPEWKAANARFQTAFARLRKFNAVFVKRFAKELRDESARRYGRR